MDAKGMSCTSHYLTAKFNSMDNVYHSRTPPYYFGVDNVSNSGAPNLDNTLNLNITVHMPFGCLSGGSIRPHSSFVE